MSKSAFKGKKHITNVYEALKLHLHGQSIFDFSEPIQETVRFIIELYPNIENVISKYDMEQPDQHPDLLLNLSNGEKIKVNLFSIVGAGRIQPKNLGAKSFLKKYFKLDSLQNEFNLQFERLYRGFLKTIVSKKLPVPTYESLPELRKTVRSLYPKFSREINPIRSNFLFEVREMCFDLLKNVYNDWNEGFEYAFRELMLLDSVNIITRYTTENKCLCVEKWQSNIQLDNIQLYKKGNDSIGFRSGEEALTIRFKFESSPSSSIKLATSFDTFPTENTVLQTNLESIRKFEKILNVHSSEVKKNSSNAIGKCNEAIVYYQMLKRNPNIKQVDEESFINMIKKYSKSVTPATLEDVRRSSVITAEKIELYLQDEYPTYEIESIQLVPDSYIENRLDTGDLQLILLVNGKYVEEKLSLKALGKSGGNITVKNPGIGTILGPLFFDVGSLKPVVDETKEEFEQGKLNHKLCLEKVSAELGEALVSAPQSKLKKGLQGILGSATAIITYYQKDECFILEHEDIQGEIVVYPETPTPIQTKLEWNESKQELTLRVKFSKGQQHGWSSLKLACEYKVHL